MAGFRMYRSLLYRYSYFVAVPERCVGERAVPMKKINFVEKSALLEEILNIKLKGKLLLDFQTRSVADFEQLRREIEANYLRKRGRRCINTHNSGSV